MRRKGLLKKGVAFLALGLSLGMIATSMISASACKRRGSLSGNPQKSLSGNALSGDALSSDALSGDALSGDANKIRKNRMQGRYLVLLDSVEIVNAQSYVIDEEIAKQFGMYMTDAFRNVNITINGSKVTQHFKTRGKIVDDRAVYMKNEFCYDAKIVEMGNVVELSNGQKKYVKFNRVADGFTYTYDSNYKKTSTTYYLKLSSGEKLFNQTCEVKFHTSPNTFVKCVGSSYRFNFTDAQIQEVLSYIDDIDVKNYFNNINDGDSESEDANNNDDKGGNNKGNKNDNGSKNVENDKNNSDKNVGTKADAKADTKATGKTPKTADSMSTGVVVATLAGGMALVSVAGIYVLRRKKENI